MTTEWTRQCALVDEGWELMDTAKGRRIHAKRGLVTVGATHDVVARVDGVEQPTTVTLLGRGRTLSEAVADLGKHGLF